MMPGPIQTWIALIDGYRTGKVPPATTTHTITDGATEYTAVKESPTVLHTQSGYDRQTYSIARCVMSEIGESSSAWHLVPIAEIIRNRSTRLQIEPYQLLTQLTSAKYAFTRFAYGAGTGRYASTRQDPSTKTIAVAKIALAGGSNFVPPNAEQWYEPSKDSNPIGVAKTWGADGYEWIGPLPGVQSYDYAILAFKGKRCTNDALISMIMTARDKGRGATVGPESPIPAIAATDARGVPWWMIAGGVVGAALVIR